MSVMLAEADRNLARLLDRYSVEILPNDQKGIDAACELLRPGVEVFAASLPNQAVEATIAACVQLGKAGLRPVPHVAARNLRSREDFERMLARCAEEGGADQALLLGGDRDHPVGPFSDARQLIETGLLQKHGYRRVALAVHPEGHPRVADAVLWPALLAKLELAKAGGLEPYLVGQFAFEADPIVSMARRLRAAGVTAPFRVGVAGPAQRATLIKYALMCGVGPSLRALKERQDLARSVAAGETPEALLRELAEAVAAEPGLGVDGVHLFTFASIRRSIEFIEGLRRA